MTPAEVAATLHVEASTLRRWALRFAALLSADAQQTGHHRAYTEADVTVLRDIQARFARGETTAAILAALTGDHTAHTFAGDRAPAYERVSESTQVVILDEHRPELDALRRLLEQQRNLLDQQEQHIADQAALLVQHQQTISQHQTEHERLRSDLNRARSEQAALLADVRHTLSKIPRWLRALLGLGA